MNAVERLYREHHRFVWRSLRRMGVPPEGLEDATQEVFVVAARRFAEFEGRSKVQTWLFSIALGVARNDRRTRSRRQRRLGAIAGVEQLRPVAGPRPSPTDAPAELMDLLMALDEQERAIVVLVELEGMTGQEAGEALGLSMHGVYRRLRRARLTLERLLSGDTTEPAPVARAQGGSR